MKNAAPVRLRAARAMGVTRIARVTGLDRVGVEVACAVRPGGHVLQVTNGKGETAGDAERGALCEAAELWGAEQIQPAQLVQATARELGTRAFLLGKSSSAGVIDVPRLAQARTAWRPARDLFSGEEVLLPAQAVHCPPRGAPLGPIAIRWSSNGMGAHEDPARALLHALLEAAERDGLSRTLPGGWTRAALRERKIDPATLPPRAQRLAGRISQAGFLVYLFDLRPRAAWLGLPLAGALLVDGESGPLPLTAGYACALSSDDALCAALLEAAQSRLTDVHGAREDVTPPDRPASLALAAEAARWPGKLALAAGAPLAAAEVEGSPREGRLSGRPLKRMNDVDMVLEQFRRAGFARAASVELAPPGFPLSIVKVLVPDLRVSELL